MKKILKYIKSYQNSIFIFINYLIAILILLIPTDNKIAVITLTIFFLLNLLYLYIFRQKNNIEFKIYDNINLPIFITNKSDKIKFYNKAFADLFTSTNKDLIIYDSNYELILNRHFKNFNEKKINDNISQISYESNLENIRAKKLSFQLDDKLIINLIFLINYKTEFDFLNFIYDSPTPTIVMDNKGKILQKNSSFITLLGDHKLANEKELNFFSLVNKDERSLLRERISYILMALETDNQFNTPTEVRIFTNTEKIILLYFSKILESSKSNNLIVQIIDITQYKSLEMSLIHSQKMQAIRQLVGSIAHDFNNILTALLGYCDILLSKHTITDSSFSDIMQIKHNGIRGASLIRQLLAFSKNQVLNPKIVNINEIIADTINSIKRLIGEKIQLSVFHSSEKTIIKADKNQLEQVIVNLVINAKDSMPNGGKLTIKTNIVTIEKKLFKLNNFVFPDENETIEAGEYVEIDITDTGHGIPKNIMNRVFEPFFSTKHPTKGTGLGLSTAYGIIKQSGGILLLKSYIDKGTTFKILFKLEKNLLTSIPETKNNQDAKIDLTGDETILIIEDEGPVREFSIIALKNLGYNIIGVESAEKAIELIEQQNLKFDLIIADINLPGMSGIEFINHIKSKDPNIKVLYISGYYDDKFIQLEKANYLEKPFSLKALTLTVKKILTKENSTLDKTQEKE